MSDILEIMTGLLVFIVLIWPVIGYFWIMRWIGRQEKQALANILQEESTS